MPLYIGVFLCFPSRARVGACERARERPCSRARSARLLPARLVFCALASLACMARQWRVIGSNGATSRARFARLGPPPSPVALARVPLACAPPRGRGLSGGVAQSGGAKPRLPLCGPGWLATLANGAAARLRLAVGYLAHGVLLSPVSSW